MIPLGLLLTSRVIVELEMIVWNIILWRNEELIVSKNVVTVDLAVKTVPNISIVIQVYVIDVDIFSVKIGIALCLVRQNHSSNKHIRIDVKPMIKIDLRDFVGLSSV